MTSVATGRDFRMIARRRLPHFLFEYYDGAAFDGITLQANEADLAGTELRQRVLRDVSKISLTTSYWGNPLEMPVILGPVGLAGLAASRGEVQAARAARSAGIPFVLSSTSICSLSEVEETAVPWFQLYMVRDRKFVARMIEWAKELGCVTLVLTVDLPVLGRRWADGRSGLSDPGLRGKLRRSAQILRRPSWAMQVGGGGRPHTLGNIAHFLGAGTDLQRCMAWTTANIEAALDWTALDWVREQWPGKLIVKGVMDLEDGRLARERGADALVVSNHGGRQLDGVRSTARALSSIASELKGKIPLFVDGGVRTGADVVRMLALGADGVFLGRLWLFALAAAGETGVKRMLSLLAEEMLITMALIGCTSVTEIDRGCLDQC